MLIRENFVQAIKAFKKADNVAGVKRATAMSIIKEN